MLRKILLDKISDTKDTLFLLSRAPTHHSFTFNLRFLYELKQQVCLSKTVCGTFHFWSRSAFIKVYIFVQNARTLLLYKVIFPFKIKIIEKPHTVLLPDLWFLSCIKMFLNSVISAWLKRWQVIKCSQSKFWERQFFFSIVTFKYMYIPLLNNLF